MGTPLSRRKVQLIDARATGRPLVAAEVYRDYPVAELDNIEERWTRAREEAAIAGLTAGLVPLEHEHWDWRNKAYGVEMGQSMLVAVECVGEVQGLMAVLRNPRPAQIGVGQVVYVDYVETAPWNLKAMTISPRFFGVGTVLIAEAIRLSLELGLGGRVGLHSLPQAESFYTRCRMTNLGPDQSYYDLTYFEHSDQQAIDWLDSIGESL